MPATVPLDYATSNWITERRFLIDAQLEKLLAPAQASPITEAMRYSVIAQGKRIRPLLTMAITDFLGVAPACAMHVGCAIEMIHCASLILDDLPCMDNDRERRNRPSTHVEFGEGLTILAAVSLLTQSHSIIASHETLAENVRLQLIQLLSRTVGSSGLSLGQHIDLHSKTANPSPAVITDIHHLKTGVLFLAAAKAGCLICGASPDQEEKIMRFTSNVGLAFQLLDDLKDLDAVETNMVTKIGVSSAERKIRDYLHAANAAIDGEDNASSLQNFAQAFIKIS